MLGIILSAIKIIFLLGFLIFIHEGGHFITAKLCNIKVNQFAIGFGPEIISKENAENVLSMMNSVVSEGTGKNARVEGYQVGGKTGTSEDGVNTGKYVTSFCGVAETDNPSIVLLITLYNPTGEGGHQGGGVAAPVGGKILNEVLPYLDSKNDQ